MGLGVLHVFHPLQLGLESFPGVVVDVTPPNHIVDDLHPVVRMVRVHVSLPFLAAGEEYQVFGAPGK